MKVDLLIAAFDPMQNLPGAAPEQGGLEMVGGNLLVLVFAALLVVLVVLAWVFFIRKPVRTVAVTPEEAAAATVGKSGRRRKIKQRYPTLAETGGLPPAKS